MKHNPFSLFAAILAASALISTANAATFYWDAAAVVVDSASAGGTGAWTIGAPGWEDGVSAQNWADANDAVLAGTAGTVTLGGPISATSVAFNTTAYNLTLAGNALTSGALNYGGAAAGSLTITGNAGASNAANVVTLNGAGTGWAAGTSVFLTGASNPTAGTATQNGPLAKLVFGNATALGSAELKVKHGMIQTGSAGMTITNAITNNVGGMYFGGENNFTVSGLLKLDLNNSRTTGVWEGSTGARTITLGNMDTNGTGFFNFEARGATPATPNTGGGFIVNGAITGAGGISTVSSIAFIGNTVTLNGTNTYTGATAHSSGTIAVSGTGSITATSAVTVNNTAVMTNAGSITSVGAITLNGNGVTGGTLSTSGTATSATAGLNGNLNLTGGSMTVSGQFNVGESAGNYGVINHSLGTMNISTAVADGIRIGHWTTTANTSAYNLSGGTLNALNNTFNVGWDGKAALAISGGTANLKGLANGAGGHGGNPSSISLTAGRLNIGTSGISQNGGGAKTFNLGVATVGAFGNWTGSAAMALTDAATGTTFDTLDSVDLTTARTITISGVLSGAGKLVKAGAGTLTLTNIANSFAGDVTVTSGTLAGNGSTGGTNTVLGLASGSRTITVNSGGTLSMISNNVLGNSTQTLANTIKVINNSSTTTTSAYNVIGNIDLNGGLLTATAGSSAPYQTYEFNGSTVTVGGLAASTISSTAPSNGGMHIAGTKTLTLDVGDVAVGTDLTISAALINGSNDRLGSGALTKTGAGTLVLSGANTYTGDTTVNAGVLAVNGTSIADGNKLVIDGSGKVDLTGTETVNTLFFGLVQQPAGDYTTAGDATHFSGAGTLHVVTGPGYATWQAANAPGQTKDQDHDNDGVSNGIEYFMGLSGSGFTANPALSGGTVTWTKGGSYTGVYGTDFLVQSSTDLVTWVLVPVGTDPVLGTVVNNAGSVTYTPPVGQSKRFGRLVVNN